jgi:hypothetical protein
LRARLGLGEGITAHAFKIALCHFGAEFFAPAGIDFFANHDERHIITDDDGVGFGLENSLHA